MSKGTINRVIIVGNVGADPDVRETKTGQIVNLRVATTDSRKNQQGQYEDETEWHRITVFGKTAEAMAQYCKKGNKVYVEGRIKQSKYTDKKDGTEKVSVEIIATDVQLLNRIDGDSKPSATKHAAPDLDDDIPF